MPDIPYANEEGSTVAAVNSPMEDVPSAPAGPATPTTGQLWPRGDW